MTFIRLQETQPGYYITATCFSQQEAEVIQAQALLPAKVQHAPNCTTPNLSALNTSDQPALT